MGDTADLMLEGVLCQACGGLVDEMGDGDGYPRNCAGCDEEAVPEGLPDDDAKKAKRRAKARGQRWRRRHHDALVTAAMRFGEKPSEEALRRLAKRAAEFGKLYRSKREAKEIVDGLFAGIPPTEIPDNI